MQPQQPSLVAKAVVPDYALGAHTASLGLTSSLGTSLPKRFSNGMFIGQHGSWNRKPFSGYQVIFVPFKNGKPSGMPLSALTGFLSEKAMPMADLLEWHWIKKVHYSLRTMLEISSGASMLKLIVS